MVSLTYLCFFFLLFLLFRPFSFNTSIHLYVFRCSICMCIFFSFADFTEDVYFNSAWILSEWFAMYRCVFTERQSGIRYHLNSFFLLFYIFFPLDSYYCATVDYTNIQNACFNKAESTVQTHRKKRKRVREKKNFHTNWSDFSNSNYYKFCNLFCHLWQHAHRLNVKSKIKWIKNKCDIAMQCKSTNTKLVSFRRCKGKRKTFCFYWRITIWSILFFIVALPRVWVAIYAVEKFLLIWIFN